MPDLFSQLSRWIAQALDPDACLVALGFLSLLAAILLNVSRGGDA